MQQNNFGKKMPQGKKSSIRKKSSKKSFKKSTTRKKSSTRKYYKSKQCVTTLTDVQSLMKFAQNVFLELMLESNEMRKEMGGYVDELFQIHNLHFGEEFTVDTHCRYGALASFHTHGPMSVLTLPEEDVFFAPPSEADIYNLLINAVLRQNKYSIVFTREGIFLLEITDRAIEQTRRELRDVMEQEQMRQCMWLLQPKLTSRGSFSGFQPNDDFAFLSTVLAQGSVTDIFNNAVSFDDALERYRDSFEQYGIKVYFERPVHPMPSREVYLRWKEEKQKLGHSWKEFLLAKQET